MDWPYIAGFFDGEGCFTHRLKGSKITNRFTATMAQTVRQDSDVLKEIYEFLNKRGIKSYLRDMKPHKAHHTPFKQLTISANSSIVAFIEAALPYLVVKRKKAEEVLVIYMFKDMQIAFERQKAAARLDAACNAYKEGLAAFHTTRRFGVSPNTLRAELRRRNIPVRGFREATNLSYTQRRHTAST